MTWGSLCWLFSIRPLKPCSTLLWPALSRERLTSRDCLTRLPWPMGLKQSLVNGPTPLPHAGPATLLFLCGHTSQAVPPPWPQLSPTPDHTSPPLLLQVRGSYAFSQLPVTRCSTLPSQSSTSAQTFVNCCFVKLHSVETFKCDILLVLSAVTLINVCLHRKSQTFTKELVQCCRR